MFYKGPHIERVKKHPVQQLFDEEEFVASWGYKTLMALVSEYIIICQGLKQL